MALGGLEVACSLHNSAVAKNASGYPACRQVPLATIWYLEFSVRGWCLQLFQQELKRACCLVWYRIAEAGEMARPLHHFYIIQKAELSAFSVSLEWKCSSLHNLSLKCPHRYNEVFCSSAVSNFRGAFIRKFHFKLHMKLSIKHHFSLNTFYFSASECILSAYISVCHGFQPMSNIAFISYFKHSLACNDVFEEWTPVSIFI